MTANFAVAGLLFGDEGKGITVDALVRRTGEPSKCLVVRYNGGAQAAHHVYADGQKHCFSQWGSGTLAGAHTYLSEHVLIEPLWMAREAAHLQEMIEANPFEKLTISPACPIITPYDTWMSKAREAKLGHGSTGSGIGEVWRQIRAGHEVPRAFMLRAEGWLRQAVFDRQQRALVATDDKELRERLSTSPDSWIEKIMEVAPQLSIRSAPEIRGPVVFEGAQGVLLDERHGFHPHTTWGDTTFNQALQLATEWGIEAPKKIGVTRTFATRHGAGPLPTESSALRHLAEQDDNKVGILQGPFRAGHLDAVLLDYACGVAQPDALSITHCDVFGEHTEAMVCTAYHGIEPLQITDQHNLEVQLLMRENVTNRLRSAMPCYEKIVDVPRWLGARYGEVELLICGREGKV